MIFLIGGGEIGRGNTIYNTETIDQAIVKSTNKEKPNFLFIGLASSFSDSYYDTIKKIYRNLGCQTAYLKKKNIINNPDIVINKIKIADIIYIGGGDTIKLLEAIKTYKIDNILKEAYEEGTVLVGISAGAILLSKGGYSDSLILRGESQEFKYLEGLNFIDIDINPHHNENLEKTKSLEKYLKTTHKTFYGLENQTALKIVGNTFEVIKSNPEKEVYKLTYQTKLIEEKLNL